MYGLVLAFDPVKFDPGLTLFFQLDKKRTFYNFVRPDPTLYFLSNYFLSWQQFGMRLKKIDQVNLLRSKVVVFLLQEGLSCPPERCQEFMDDYWQSSFFSLS
jgi:hypothetical protein